MGTSPRIDSIFTLPAGSQTIASSLIRGGAAHPLWSVFIVAIFVRAVIALVVTQYFSGTLVLDVTAYDMMAEQMAEGATESWDVYTSRLYWTTATFMLPVTLIYKVFGPSPLVAQLFVALLGSLTAVFVARLALEFISPRWALTVGLVVALLPSQAFWSSMLMKDASVWFTLSGLAAATAIACRSHGRRLFLLGISASAFLVLLSYLRLHTLVVAAWALMIAAFFGVRQDRVARIAGALVIGIMVPWLFGAIGPAGLSLVTNAGSLEDRRFANALGANTAVVDTSEPPAPPTVGNVLGLDSPEVGALQTEAESLQSQATASTSRVQVLEAKAEEQDRVSPRLAERLRERAQRLRTRVATLRARAEALRAQASAVLAERENPVGIGQELLDPNLAHLPRGLSVMLLEPFPVPFSGSASLRLARLESVLWYVLLLLAGYGLWHVRLHLREMAFPTLAGAGILVMYALTEGNIGTAHRHRGEFVWVVALLAGLGAKHLIDRGRLKVH